MVAQSASICCMCACIWSNCFLYIINACLAVFRVTLSYVIIVEGECAGWGEIELRAAANPVILTSTRQIIRQIIGVSCVYEPQLSFESWSPQAGAPDPSCYNRAFSCDQNFVY